MEKHDGYPIIRAGLPCEVIRLRISQEEFAALERFRASFGRKDGCDVPDAMMRRLAEIGVIRTFIVDGAHTFTEIGLAVLRATPEVLENAIKAQTIVLAVEPQA